MAKRRILVLLLASFLFLPAAAEAEEEEVQLSLNDALLMALDNNLDLKSARLDPEISAQSVIDKQAAFDGTIESSLFREEATQEPTNQSQSPGTNTSAASVTWNQALNFGATYSAGLSSFRYFRDLTDGNFYYSSPTTYGAGLDLSFSLPLLRGLGKEATQTELLLARGNLDISREQLRSQAHATIETVENAYWDLVATRESLRIARLSLARAEDTLELNRKKVEVGTLAPIEITEAEAGVAAQEETVIIEETNLLNAEDELRRLLAVPDSDPMWMQSVLPTNDPIFSPSPIDLEATIEQALASRPELASAHRELRNEELSYRTAKNGLKHKLNLELAYRPTGRDLDLVDPATGALIGEGSMSEAFQELADFEYRTWSATLNYTYEFNKRAARSRFRTAELNLSKAKIGLQNEEQSVRVDVRRAVRAVESGVKRVQAARANVVLQQKKLDAEQKKFENGMSTSFEILTFQRDLASAELSEVNALIDYTKALAALEKAKGTLLEARGLSLASR